MDSLNDILSLKNFDEPTESLAIKKYAREQFNEAVAVTIHEREIIIAAPNAAMANTLRMRIVALQKLVGKQRRLVFRIGK